jgi:hypothetical protein
MRPDRIRLLALALLLAPLPATADTIRFHFEGVVDYTEDPTTIEVGTTVAFDYFIDEAHPDQDASDPDAAFFSADDGPIVADVYLNGGLFLGGLAGRQTGEGSTNFLSVDRDFGGSDVVDWKASDDVAGGWRASARFLMSASTLPPDPGLADLRTLTLPANANINLSRSFDDFSAEVNAYSATLEETETAAPPSGTATALIGARPNPFNPATEIVFRLGQASQIELEVFDLRGRQVRSLARGDRAAGEHRIPFDGRDDSGRSLASGSYLVRLVTDTGVHGHRITLLK